MNFSSVGEIASLPLKNCFSWQVEQWVNELKTTDSKVVRSNKITNNFIFLLVCIFLNIKI